MPARTAADNRIFLGLYDVLLFYDHVLFYVFLFLDCFIDTFVDCSNVFIKSVYSLNCSYIDIVCVICVVWV